MKRVMIIFSICLMLLTGSAFADIYKCKSPSGVTIFSDEPCAEDAKVFIEESATSVDEAVAEEIDLKSGSWSETQRRDNISADARRIANTILPNVFFTSADVIHIKYSPSDPPPAWFDRPTPHMKYDRIPGWEVNLVYHSASKEDEYNLKFRFDQKSVKQISGDSKYACLLRTIAVKKNGKPFVPETMRNLQHMKSTALGQWKYLR